MKKKKWLTTFLLIDQIGITMVVSILVSLFIGIFLDKITGLSPLFLVIFILLGVGAGFRNIYRMIDKEIKRGEEEKDD